MMLLTQLIGFLALFIAWTASLFKDDKKLLYTDALACFFWTVHFFLLGLPVAALINFLSIFRNVLAVKYKKNAYLMIVFVILFSGVGLFGLEKALISFLPIIASVIGIVAAFYFDTYALRFFLILGLLLWMIYNYIGGSLAGLVADGVSIVFLFISMLKIKYPKFLKNKYFY